MKKQILFLGLTISLIYANTFTSDNDEKDKEEYWNSQCAYSPHKNCSLIIGQATFCRHLDPINFNISTTPKCAFSQVREALLKIQLSIIINL